jgi:hypothetical protein
MLAGNNGDCFGAQSGSDQKGCAESGNNRQDAFYNEAYGIPPCRREDMGSGRGMMHGHGSCQRNLFEESYGYEQERPVQGHRPHERHPGRFHECQPSGRESQYLDAGSEQIYGPGNRSFNGDRGRREPVHLGGAHHEPMHLGGAHHETVHLGGGHRETVNLGYSGYNNAAAVEQNYVAEQPVNLDAENTAETKNPSENYDLWQGPTVLDLYNFDGSSVDENVSQNPETSQYPSYDYQIPAPDATEQTQQVTDPIYQSYFDNQIPAPQAADQTQQTVEQTPVPAAENVEQTQQMTVPTQQSYFDNQIPAPIPDEQTQVPAAENVQQDVVSLRGDSMFNAALADAKMRMSPEGYNNLVAELGKQMQDNPNQLDVPLFTDSLSALQKNGLSMYDAAELGSVINNDIKNGTIDLPALVESYNQEKATTVSDPDTKAGSDKASTDEAESGNGNALTVALNKVNTQVVEPVKTVLDTHIVQPVKTAVKPATDAIDQHIVQPVKTALKPATDAIDQHIVEPARSAINSAKEAVANNDTVKSISSGVHSVTSSISGALGLGGHESESTSDDSGTSKSASAASDKGSANADKSEAASSAAAGDSSSKASSGGGILGAIRGALHI